MRNKLLFVAGLVTVVALAFALTTGGAGAAPGDPKGLKHDHALFDETSGALGAFCQSDKLDKPKEFEFYGSIRAINDDATARVWFEDGDFIDFPIAEDTSFSLSQAAGGTGGVDGRLEIRNANDPDRPGKLAGWVSASSHDGTHVLCGTL